MRGSYFLMFIYFALYLIVPVLIIILVITLFGKLNTIIELLKDIKNKDIENNNIEK